MKIHHIQNFRKFDISYLGPTNTRGSRVKITEPKRFLKDKNKSIYLSYDYSISDIAQQALNHLVKLGFKPVARCSEFSHYTILCNNFGEDYIH